MKVRAAVFDMYGTVLAIDGVRAAVAAAGAGDPQRFVDAWRRKQLEYSFLCSLAQAYRDFDELTLLALRYACEQFGLSLDAPARADLARAWQSLPAYPDVAPALRALRARGVATAILTNGTRASAEAVLGGAEVRSLFDDVLSAESVRVYKPDPRVYALAPARFGCASGEIAFVSSNAWDAWGASHFGLRVAWCDRQGLPPEQLTPPPAARLAGLEELEGFVAAQR